MEHDPRRAAGYIVASAFMFALTGATVKAASARLPHTEVVFFRSFLGLIALTPWLIRSGISGLRTRRPGLHLLRGFAGLAAMYCFFYALGHLELATAVLLNYSAPLFIPFIAALWLGEPVPRALRWAIPLGFVGIALILKPGMGMLEPAALLGLAAGILAAVAFVAVRRLHSSEPTTRIVFYFGVISTVGSAVPLAWTWQTPEYALWTLLGAMGLCATGGQLLLTRAYAFAPAAQVGPFTYSVVVFSALLGWAVWGEVPGSLAILGAVLVILAGALAIRRRSPAKRSR
ncbi:DMT family transporter [Thiohalorhabdus methylotrophus]|uniref:DMT family transporter n=1 Tax=Thiohalorhabdus methylotrophus TaxID=3242694 RepID=A0ABV4U0S7_9GAMM